MKLVIVEQTVAAYNRVDENGNPAGGRVDSVGMEIEWQNGPLGRGDSRTEPNGTFVSTVIAAAKQRLEFYQSTTFACQENADAITHLKAALDVLAERTARREEQAVRNTITINGKDFPISPPHKNSVSLMSYEDIIVLASETNGATVTYRAKLEGDGKLSGILYAGKSVEVCPGMIFTVVHTGNA